MMLFGKRLIWSFLLLCPFISGAQDLNEGLVFHFDFKDAKDKNEITDKTGKIKCFSKNRDFVIQKDALRIAPCAEIYIPSENLPELKNELTVSAWILKKSTPEYAPLLFKGVHPDPIQFLFTLSWRYPAFCYKTPGKSGWGGIYINGMGGSSSRYGDENCMVKGARFVESSGFWKNLTAVFNKGIVKVYVDGDLVAEYKDKAETLTPNNSPIWIGAEKVASEKENYMSANILINDLRLYNKALPDGDVKAIYSAERAKYPEGSLIPPGETHINALPVCYDYMKAVMKGYDPEFKEKLKLTAEYEKAIPLDPYKNLKNVISSVVDNKGQTCFTVDGKVKYPLLYLPCVYDFVNNKYTLKETELGFRDFAAAGIKLGGLGIMTDFYCLDEGKYDWTKVDELFKLAVRANPETQLLVEYMVVPPPWFEKKYPEEMEKSYFGKNLRTVSRSGPLASDVWLKVSNTLLKDFVEHVEKSDYANHVAGYIMGGGQSGEWYWPGSVYGGFTGYSKATAESFRNWLKIKYGNDVTLLKKAWASDSVTFENAEVPVPEKRMAKDENSVFVDPLKYQQLFDIRAFKNDRTFLNIEENSKAIKTASGGKKLVSIFSGYALPVTSHKLYNAGLETTDRIFKSEYIDSVACLLDYAQRRGGDTGLNVNAFNGSAKLHNKLMWMEDDPRTHFHTQMESGRTATMEETLTVLKRSFGYSITRNHGVWWRLFDATWFHHDDIMKTFANIGKIAEASLSEDKSSSSEVALIFDLRSTHYMAYIPGDSFIRNQTWGTYQSAGRMGAPFDVYFMDDIDNPKMPDYKLYVFMNAYFIDKKTREAVKAKVRKNNAVSVWCYAPGYISEKGFSVEGMTDITGIKFSEERKTQKALSSLVCSDNSPVTKFYKPSEKYDVGPFFYGSDEAAEVLAVSDRKPVLLAKKFENWRSVYSLMPLTKELMMGLCDYAGVHVYSRSFDVFSSNKSYIMLHTSSKGNKTIALPAKYNVKEVLTGKTIGNGVSSFSEDLPEQETRIYQLSK